MCSDERFECLSSVHYIRSILRGLLHFSTYMYKCSVTHHGCPLLTCTPEVNPQSPDFRSALWNVALVIVVVQMHFEKQTNWFKIDCIRDCRSIL